MKKVVGAGIAGGIAIVVVVLIAVQYYALNNLQELQFSPNSVGNFDKTTLSLDIQIDACNPTQFPTGFDKMLFELDNIHNNNYNVTVDKEFATMTLQGDTLMPMEAVTLNGKIHINAETVENWWKTYNVFTSLNSDYITLKVTVETKLLGIVPMSVNEDFNYDQFVAMLVSPQATEFSCA
ncbi:MAG: hypothetical protein ACE5KA_04320 [Nitrososphaerales archaeon]